MTQIDAQLKQTAKQMLTLEEGKSSTVYQDSKGIWTAAVGRNMQVGGLRDNEIDFMLSNDVDWHYQELYSTYSWFQSLNSDRQLALINMSFNMGFQALQGFHDMIEALSVGDWQKAHDEVIDSDYYRELYVQLRNDRPLRIANAFLTGTFQLKN